MKVGRSRSATEVSANAKPWRLFQNPIADGGSIDFEKWRSKLAPGFFFVDFRYGVKLPGSYSENS